MRVKTHVRIGTGSLGQPTLGGSPLGLCQRSLASEPQVAAANERRLDGEGAVFLGDTHSEVERDIIEECQRPRLAPCRA